MTKPNAYRLAYRILGPARACLLQRVEVDIVFFRDETRVAAYGSRYWEYFQLGSDPEEERIDVHDFDVRRDGWGPNAIQRMLRRYRLQDPKGAGRVTVEKRFFLGPGRVEGAQPAHTTASGGAFGFLAVTEGLHTSAEIELCDGRTVPSAQACPFGGAPVGQGSWEGPVWSTREVFRYRLATLSGQVATNHYQTA